MSFDRLENAQTAQHGRDSNGQKFLRHYSFSDIFRAAPLGIWFVHSMISVQSWFGDPVFRGASGTENIFDGKNTQQARRTCPRALWSIAARKLDQLDSVEEVEELRVPPGNRLERLAGKRKGQYSIRINEQYRICFVWSDDGPLGVEIVDYH